MSMTQSLSRRLAEIEALPRNMRGDVLDDLYVHGPYVLDSRGMTDNCKNCGGTRICCDKKYRVWLCTDSIHDEDDDG